jgi:hypothetical protein
LTNIARSTYSQSQTKINIMQNHDYKKNTEQFYLKDK